MSNNLSGKLSLSDTNEKEFNCEVDAKDKDKASLLYNVNISKYAEEFQKEKFKIEEEEIIGDVLVFQEGFHQLHCINIVPILHKDRGQLVGVLP